VGLALPGDDFGRHRGRPVGPGAAHIADDGGNLGVAQFLLGADGGIVVFEDLLTNADRATAPVDDGVGVEKLLSPSTTRGLPAKGGNTVRLGLTIREPQRPPFSISPKPRRSSPRSSIG
jgi:hypothetical protein